MAEHSHLCPVCRVDRAAMSGIADEETRSYVIKTLLSILKQFKNEPLFSHPSVESVEVIRK